MTDPTPPPADPAVPAAPANASLRATIASVLGELLHTGKATVTADSAPAAAGAAAAPDLAGQIATAIGQVQAEQDRDSIIEGLRHDVAALKQPPQKAPKMTRRVEKIMGWRTDADE